jgi:hypothetical protein
LFLYAGAYRARKKQYVSGLRQQAAAAFALNESDVTKQHMTDAIARMVDIAPEVRLVLKAQLQHALDNTKVVDSLKKKHLADTVKLNNIEAAVVIHLQYVTHILP